MSLTDVSNNIKIHGFRKIAEEAQKEWLKLVTPRLPEPQDRPEDIKEIVIDGKKIRCVLTPPTIEQIQQKTAQYKQMLQGKPKQEQYKILEKIMPEVYAVAMEAIRQAFGYQVRDVQVIGAVGLHFGYVSEIGTGEGKTTIAALPAYLNALAGDGVQIITPNEYLAGRDAEKMKKVFNMLGLSVGANLHTLDRQQKRNSYRCDIMYSTFTELGFDYLRDNMASNPAQQVRRKNSFDSYLLIDEADSIMLDEANVPLVTSGSVPMETEDADLYKKVQSFIDKIKGIPNVYEIDKKEGKVTLIAKPKEEKADKEKDGFDLAKEYFGFELSTDERGPMILHMINNALVANFILERNKDYLVVDKNGETVDGLDPEGKVALVDENTQRKLKGRQLSKGLHQAIEAKEGVAINPESKFGSKTTVQNFVNKYSHFAGMTGTAMTDVDEFRTMYHTDVVPIPPNANTRVDDRIDTVYKTKDEKIAAIIEKVKFCHEYGIPVLVGVNTIEQSIELSEAFERAGIGHQLLNAKCSAAEENEIVANAGRKGAITIATDMAGRGTDIKVGGDSEYMAVSQMEKEGFTPDQIEFAKSNMATSDQTLIKARMRYHSLCQEYSQITKKEKKEIIRAGEMIKADNAHSPIGELPAGGLHIIGTEKHTSRRVDNQLRGRAGRNGEPGSSEFIVSLEDEFIRVQDEEGSIKRLAGKLGIAEGKPVRSPALSKAIEKYQIIFESVTSGKRMNSAKYDNVFGQLRDSFYAFRDDLISGEFSSREGIIRIIDTVVPEILKQETEGSRTISPKDYDKINERLEEFLIPKGTKLVTKEFVDGDTKASEISEKIIDVIIQNYDKNVAKNVDNIKRILERAKRDRKIQEIGLTDEEIRNFLDQQLANRLIKIMVENTTGKWSDFIEESDFLQQTAWLSAYASKDPVDAYKEEVCKAYSRALVGVLTEQCDIIHDSNKLSAIIKSERQLIELVALNNKALQSKGIAVAPRPVVRAATPQQQANGSVAVRRPVVQPVRRITPVNFGEPKPLRAAGEPPSPATFGRKTIPPTLVRPKETDQPQADRS